MMERTFYGVAIVALTVVGMGAGPNVLDGEALEANGSGFCFHNNLRDVPCLDQDPYTCNPSYVRDECSYTGNGQRRFTCQLSTWDFACATAACVDTFHEELVPDCTFY